MKLKQLHNIMHTMTAAFAAALLCMGAYSCSSDSPTGLAGNAPGSVTAGDVWLSLRLSIPSSTGRGGSRASDDAGHPEEAPNADENYIDCTGGNMALMFFDDRQLLWRVLTPQEMTVVPVGEGVYSLRFKLNDSYFGYAGKADNIECTYMFVTNMDGTGSGSTFRTDDLFAKTPDQIAAMHTCFGMPDQNGAAWIPSSVDSRLIPMSGIAHGRVSRAALGNSTSDMAADLGTLNMQRALAKIRILDAISQQIYTDIERIISVSIVGCNTHGTYIPDGPSAWFNETVDVETVTELSEWFDPYSRIAMFNTPQTSTVENTTYQNAFVCYVPECTVTHDRGIRLMITVEMKNGAPSRTYEINLADQQALEGSGGGVYGGITGIVRNHIYEFKVEAAPKAGLDLTLHVRDWESFETEWDFSDNPAIAAGGYLKWTEGTYSSMIGQEALLVLDTSTTGEGRFTLASPLGGTWTAMLVPEGQTEYNAFMFVNSDGTVTATATGKIDGEEAVIRIRPTYEPLESTNRRARLLVSVRTPDGRTLNADILQGGTYGQHTYFTIQQNAML